MADSELKLTLYGQPAFEALARAKDPDTALFYALSAANGGVCAEALAASELGFSAERARRACSLLCLYGLAGGDGGKKSALPERESDPAEIAQTRVRDMVFANLCSYLESAIGRILRRTELEALYNVYGNLGLPADVLVLLINFCKETHKLSAREIERLAYSWHDNGIDTYERAESYLQSRRELYTRTWAIRRLLGIQDRKPSDSESRYINEWAQHDVSDELLSLAYDRTTARTGKLSWAYMDKILKTWREKGIKTVKQAEMLDGARTVAPDNAQKSDSIETIVRRRFASRRQKRDEELKARITLLTSQSSEFLELEKRRRLCSSRLALAHESARGAIEAELGEITRARQALLISLGKPSDWLDDAPKCAKCGDHGYIGAVQCECFKLECERESALREGQREK